MNKVMIAGFILTMGLAGWAAAANAGGFSATRPVIAIIGNHLHTGIAEGHLDGTGTVAIRSQVNPDIKCLGEFTSSAEAGGAGQLRCSDGSTIAFKFQRLTVFTGHGFGSSSQGAMSFTYGLTPDEAGRYLKMPPGKTLKRNGEELQLAEL